MCFNLQKIVILELLINHTCVNKFKLLKNCNIINKFRK